jgi:hypothetical protein
VRLTWCSCVRILASSWVPAVILFLRRTNRRRSRNSLPKAPRGSIRPVLHIIRRVYSAMDNSPMCQYFTENVVRGWYGVNLCALEARGLSKPKVIDCWASPHDRGTTDGPRCNKQGSCLQGFHDMHWCDLITLAGMDPGGNK